MKRIDKIISEQTNYTRSEIKTLVSKGHVFVNNVQVKKPEEKFDEENVTILVNGEVIDMRKHFYLILNKPEGYVSSTDEPGHKTVLDLVPEKYKTKELFPAGRLDKDTTGLMLITDDGEFAHDILSPRKHVKKEYEVTIDIPVTKEMAEGFEKGIMLNDGECKSAILFQTGEYTANVTLKEGRYHQIKRMFGCFGAKVTKLNRIGMGELSLPKDLAVGEIREATEEELKLISSREQ